MHLGRGTKFINAFNCYQERKLAPFNLAHPQAPCICIVFATPRVMPIADSQNDQNSKVYQLWRSRKCNTWSPLLTLTTVAWVRRVAASLRLYVILCVCPHDKTKTDENKIIKLVTWMVMVHHDTSPTIMNRPIINARLHGQHPTCNEAMRLSGRRELCTYIECPASSCSSWNDSSAVFIDHTVAYYISAKERRYGSQNTARPKHRILRRMTTSWQPQSVEQPWWISIKRKRVSLACNNNTCSF